MRAIAIVGLRSSPGRSAASGRRQPNLITSLRTPQPLSQTASISCSFLSYRKTKDIVTGAEKGGPQKGEVAGVRRRPRLIYWYIEILIFLDSKYSAAVSIETSQPLPFHL